MLSIYRVISLSLLMSLFFAAPLLFVHPVSIQQQKAQALATKRQLAKRVTVAWQKSTYSPYVKAADRLANSLRDAEYVYEMDPDFDGNPRAIRVRITVDHETRSATIDFTGTTAQLATNYNAPEPVTRAAVLYVFRCLVDDAIPMNEGVMKPLNVILPKGTMLSPEYPAAVIAGNVETSQAVTSALFLALGVMAAAQSTMNNTTWGNATYQYYETICGGSGAGVLNDGTGHDGADAVHIESRRERRPSCRGGECDQ